MPLLFSYGTLQQENVQRATFGRLLAGGPDTLVGYAEALVRIEDAAVVATSGRTHHPIVRRSGVASDRVAGTVFEITDAELALADRYEVDAYVRESARLASGRQAWVYVAASQASELACAGTASMAAPALDQVLARLAAAGIALPPGRVRLDGYGDSEALSAELIALIRAGRKRAGTSLLWGLQADDDPMPARGDIEIVLDFHGRPVLVTRLVEVDVRRFDAVDARYAAIEGEGDGSLESWREAHWRYFARDCARIGREPAPDMPVVCSVFELVCEVQPGE